MPRIRKFSHGRNFIFVSTIPMAKKCTSNFFGVSLQFCWLLVGSDCNWIQYCDYQLPLPLDNRELASSYRQFQYVHYLYREYLCIVLYLFPPSIWIAFIIFIVITNALVSFCRQFQCVYNLFRENLCFLLMVSLIRDLNVLFLQGYFSISPISPTPTSLHLCPEDQWKYLLSTFYGFLCWCFLVWKCNFLLIGISFQIFFDSFNFELAPQLDTP